MYFGTLIHCMCTSELIISHLDELREIHLIFCTTIQSGNNCRNQNRESKKE
ncbi:hypothetical protein [Anaerotignum propionicum]|uniref:hypothetical protein n=1 Tax=Anaerotignum propionicum TaxID=28446 RepID=UPI0012FEE84C|nr:hypothetical protein [Anaerotignum propionicum]